MVTEIQTLSLRELSISSHITSHIRQGRDIAKGHKILNLFFVSLNGHQFKNELCSPCEVLGDDWSCCMVLYPSCSAKIW